MLYLCSVWSHAVLIFKQVTQALEIPLYNIVREAASCIEALPQRGWEEGMVAKKHKILSWMQAAPC